MGLQGLRFDAGGGLGVGLQSGISLSGHVQQFIELVPLGLGSAGEAETRAQTGGNYGLSGNCENPGKTARGLRDAWAVA